MKQMLLIKGSRVWIVVVVLTLVSLSFAAVASAAGPVVVTKLSDLPVEGQVVIPPGQQLVPDGALNGVKVTAYLGMGDKDDTGPVNLATDLAIKRGGLDKYPVVIFNSGGVKADGECKEIYQDGVAMELHAGEPIGHPLCYTAIEYSFAGTGFTSTYTVSAVITPTLAVTPTLAMTPTIGVTPTVAVTSPVAALPASVTDGSEISTYAGLPIKGQLIIPFGMESHPPAEWRGMNVTIWRGMHDDVAPVAFGQSIGKDRGARYGGTDYPTLVWTGHPIPDWVSRTACDKAFGSDAAILNPDTSYGDGGCFEMIEYDSTGHYLLGTGATIDYTVSMSGTEAFTGTTTVNVGAPGSVFGFTLELPGWLKTPLW